MHRSALGVFAALLLAVFIAAPGAAAQPAAAAAQPVADDTATELVRIRVALERIARTLERQVERQRAELAMGRLAMESEGALRLERQIAEVTSNRDSLEDERFRMQAQLLSVVRDAERPEPSYTDADVERLREQFELQVQLVESRIGELDRRLQELQNQLAARREAVNDWQALIDRHLQIE